MGEPKAEVPKFIAEWFEGKTREALKAIEHGERLLWPETLKKRGADGKIIELPCMLATPRVSEKAQSIILANAHVAKAAKSKEVFTRDQAISHVGFDSYSELETVALLSFAIREAKPPHPQMYMFPMIADAVPMASLYELYDRLDFYSRLEDVRVEELTDEMFWAFVRNIAKVENLSPLAVTAGSVRDSLITTMAVRLASLETQRLSALLSETSTPELSTPPS